MAAVASVPNIHRIMLASVLNTLSPRRRPSSAKSDKPCNSSVDRPLLWGAEARTRKPAVSLSAAPKALILLHDRCSLLKARVGEPEHFPYAAVSHNDCSAQWTDPPATSLPTVRHSFTYAAPVLVLAVTGVAIASLARLFAIRGDVKIGAYAVRADVGG